MDLGQLQIFSWYACADVSWKLNSFLRIRLEVHPQNNHRVKQHKNGQEVTQKFEWISYPSATSWIVSSRQPD